MIELVVFDTAGTTVEDGGQVFNAFRDALGRQQIAVTEADLRPWRGASKRSVLRAFVERQWGPQAAGNDQRVEEAYAVFQSSLEQGFGRADLRPIPGTGATFEWLRARGIKIALTTGFYRRVADPILERMGWTNGAIDASICSDDVAQGRPAPYMIFRAMEATGALDVRRVAKVGDTLLDLQAGRNAGAGLLVGVLSGSGTREALERVEGARIMASVADLPALLDQGPTAGK